MFLNKEKEGRVSLLGEILKIGAISRCCSFIIYLLGGNIERERERERERKKWMRRCRESRSASSMIMSCIHNEKS